MALTRKQLFELFDYVAEWTPDAPVWGFVGLNDLDIQSVYIYALQGPRTNLVRYIGKTTTLDRRLKQHLACEGANTARVAWIAELEAQDLVPEMVILEECDMETWQAAEIAWIAKARVLGWPLLNITEGGEAGGRIGFQKVLHE